MRMKVNSTESFQPPYIILKVPDTRSPNSFMNMEQIHKISCNSSELPRELLKPAKNEHGDIRFATQTLSTLAIMEVSNTEAQSVGFAHLSKCEQSCFIKPCADGRRMKTLHCFLWPPQMQSFFLSGDSNLSKDKVRKEQASTGSGETAVETGGPACVYPQSGTPFPASSRLTGSAEHPAQASLHPQPGSDFSSCLHSPNSTCVPHVLTLIEGCPCQGGCSRRKQKRVRTHLFGPRQKRSPFKGDRLKI